MATISEQQAELEIYQALEMFFSERLRGGFYTSGTRPEDSRTEDAVVGVSAVTAEQIQTGRARINVYVPDLDNGSGHPVPDKARLAEISSWSDEVAGILDETLPWEFWLFQAASVSAERIDGTTSDSSQHCVTIAVQFKTQPN